MNINCIVTVNMDNILIFFYIHVDSFNYVTQNCLPSGVTLKCNFINCLKNSFFLFDAFKKILLKYELHISKLNSEINLFYSANGNCKYET